MSAKAHGCGSIGVWAPDCKDNDLRRCSLPTSVPSLRIAPNLAQRLTGRLTRPSGPLADLNALLERIRQRLYPENIPVLASWWLKTVFSAGHNLAWWGELDAAIGTAVSKNTFDRLAVEAMTDIQTWIRHNILAPRKPPEPRAPVVAPFRPDMTHDEATSYLYRVLNEWLPGEVARLLTTEPEFAVSDESGMPALVIARVIERLLVRERFSPATLELLLQVAWSSPKYAYPADVEIFSDVALALLGRTAAPAAPVLPATALAGGFADAVRQASLASSKDGDELRIPLDQEYAMELLKHDPMRIGSVLVTMDGRCWQSSRLQSGPETVIVYRAVKRLRIDFNSEHARLIVPWPDSEERWPGAVHLPENVSLFGRQWRGLALERSADQTWLYLEFSGILPIAKAPDVDKTLRHLRPASVEMGWSEVEQALADGSESIDRLHRDDLIPLARALQRLLTCVLRPWPSRAEMERLLLSVRYLHGAVAPTYGPIPWRVLSDAARKALLKRTADAGLTNIVSETFESGPEFARTSPPRAA